ncbi:GNAT family N-acetyltransferase [Pseudomonas wadenswilerensis]
MIIRPTRPSDATLLPAIERSAAQSFTATENLAWLAGHDVLSVEQHLGFIAQGLHWLAVDEHDQALGFVCASAVDDTLHIEELSVARSSQGQGLGRALVGHLECRARDAGFKALSLTTFATVPWNAPFYARLGFQRLDDAQAGEFLRQQLRHEQAIGLPDRCAMGKTL